MGRARGRFRQQNKIQSVKVTSFAAHLKSEAEPARKVADSRGLPPLIVPLIPADDCCEVRTHDTANDLLALGLICTSGVCMEQ